MIYYKINVDLKWFYEKIVWFTMNNWCFCIKLHLYSKWLIMNLNYLLNHQLMIRSNWKWFNLIWMIHTKIQMIHWIFSWFISKKIKLFLKIQFIQQYNLDWFILCIKKIWILQKMIRVRIILSNQIRR